MINYEKRFDDILAKIEAARLETDEYNIVKIVAASKYADTKAIKSVYEIGQRSFGENRVQDLKSKCEELKDIPIDWQFIGTLQKNKINALLDLSPSLIHSIDSLELAQEVDKRAKAKDMTQSVLLQINSAKEESKSGCLPESAVELYHEIKESCKNLRLRGVMSIGAHTDDQDSVKKSFETTFKIFEELKREGAKYCCMGMSEDFELAIKCGSNMVRIGSALFK
jgi:pyridoxal phosphate enzyme (YggS family)